MKKRLIRFLVAAFVCFSVSPMIAESANVTYVVGKAEVNRGGEWIPLKVNDKVNESETINTGFQSELVLNFNGHAIKVAAMSRVKLNTLTASENKVSISVNSGSVRSKVSKPKDGSKANYTAGTPVAVASVRGTDFIISASGTVICSEGKVSVWSRRKYDSLVEKAEKKIKQTTSKNEEIEIQLPEIDDWKFGGDVRIEKGQTTSLSTSGDPRKPMTEASSILTKPRLYVTTAAEKDALTEGGQKAVSFSANSSNVELEVEITGN